MRWTLALIVTFICTVIPGSAHVVIPAEFREVVGDATLIVRGQVTDVRSVVQPGIGIESIATIAVESTLKGTADPFVYVRVPGGEVGRSRIVMVGAPRLQLGQRAVFFLKPSGLDSSYRPIGLTLGIYRVQPDPATGRLVVPAPVIAGRTAPSTGAVARGDSRRKPMQVQEFEALVRTVATTSGPTRAVPRQDGTSDSRRATARGGGR